jgi:hypothetical protein
MDKEHPRIASIYFGYDPEDKGYINAAVYLKEAIRLGGVGKDPYTVKLYLRGLYETNFGIYNHYGHDVKPLALMTLHPSEDIDLECPLDDVVKSYDDYGILEMWGLNIREYLSLPRYMIDALKRVGTSQREIRLNRLKEKEKT